MKVNEKYNKFFVRGFFLTYFVYNIEKEKNIMEDIENLFKKADFSKETNFKKELKKELDSWIDKLEENQMKTDEYLLSDDELDLAVAAGNQNSLDDKNNT